MLSKTKPIKLEVAKRQSDKKFAVWGLYIQQDFDISKVDQFVEFGVGTVPARLPTQWQQVFVSDSEQKAKEYVSNYFAQKAA